MIALVLALCLASDGGAPPSGFIGIRSGIFLTDRGETLIADGGAWANDATLIETARRERALRENLKLANDVQQQEITKWIGLGAGIGGLGTALIFVVIYLFSGLGR